MQQRRATSYAGIALDELAEATRRHGRAAADLPIIEDEEDEDLAWVEREIQKCEDGPNSVFTDTPELRQIRNERLARLKQLRARLLGEESM